MVRIVGVLLAAPLCLVPSAGPVASAPAINLSPLGADSSPSGPAVVRAASVGRAGGDRHSEAPELPPGERLIKILKDPKQPRAQRAAAAEKLGRLGYLPAISVLFDHITMTPAYKPGDKVIFHENGQIEWTSDEFDDHILFSGPCVDALRQYGAEVIPQAIKRYLSPQFRHHRGHLRSVLRGQDRPVQDAVRTLRPAVTDPQQLQLLIELYKFANGDMTDFERPPGPKPWERPRDRVG